MAKIGPFTISVLKDADLAIKQIVRGLLDLTFADNFNSRTVEVSIPAGTEVAVANPFPDGAVPLEWWPVDRTGNGTVTRGAAAWGRTLSFANASATDDVAATIRLFRR